MKRSIIVAECTKAPTQPPPLYLSPGATLVSGSAPENDVIVLACPSTKQIISRIIFSSYGLPSGNGLNAHIGSCNSLNSESVANNLCKNKYSCSVPATNG